MTKRKFRHKKAKYSLGTLALAIAIIIGARLLGIDLPSADNNTDSPPANPQSTTTTPRDTPTTQSPSDAELITRLYNQQRSGVMVTLTAEVAKTLPDDNEGSRHQKFLIDITRDHSVLIAHNIDLAPRVPLREGDTVTIHGQYEYSEKGGTIHWTHHDPRNRREGGWIEHEGRRYD